MLQFLKSFPVKAFLFSLTFAVLCGAQETVLEMHKGESIGDVTVNKETMFTDLRGVGRSYYITVPKSSTYFISVITNCCAGSEYTVTIDRQNYVEGKVLLDDGWKAGFVVDKKNDADAKAFTLSGGDHAISFIGKGPEVPYIERIRIAATEAAAALSAGDLIAGNRAIAAQPPLPDYDKKKAANTLTAAATLADSHEPNYAYVGQTDVPLVYSYFFTASLTAGTTVTYETRNCGSGDPVLYLFHSTTPVPPSKSWSNDDFAAPDRNAKITFTVPVTATYNGIVTYYWGNGTGACDLYRNGTKIASQIQFGGSYLNCQSYTSPGGLLNCFTAKPEINPVGNTAFATRLFIISGDAMSSPINAYNDFYQGTGSFAWGVLSRIKKTFVVEPKYALVTQKNSGYPGRTIDVYTKCGDGSSLLSGGGYPNFKADDAIKSAEASSSYNCLLWTGGITYVDINRMKYLADLTGFLGSARYPGCMLFTMVPNVTSSPDEAVLAWSYTGKLNESLASCDHASIKKPGNFQYHGYDWESKCGTNIRVFHPRMALSGPNGYGNIIAVYKVSGTASTAKMEALGIKGPLTYEESVNLGLAKEEEVVYSTTEQAKLTKYMANTPAAVKNEFTARFTNWSNTWTRLPLINSSVIDDYAASAEYKALVAFCQKQGKVIWPMLLDAVEKANHFAAGRILDDCIPQMRTSLQSTITAENEADRFTSDGTMVIHTGRGNLRKLCKSMLETDFQ